MHRLFTIAALATAVTAATAMAQTGTGRTTQLPDRNAATGARSAATDAAQTTGAQNLDQAIAACLLLMNHEEVAIAQFAEQHAENERVKQFIATLVEDHRNAAQKLRQAAPQLTSLNLELESGRTGDARNSAFGAADAARGVDVAAAGAADARRTSAAQPMIAMQQRIASECLQLTQQLLSQHEGADFDRCFIGQQMAAHVSMLAKLRGSEQFATGQLRNYISELARSVEQHLETTKQIAKTLEEEQRNRSTDQASRGDDPDSRG